MRTRALSLGSLLCVAGSLVCSGCSYALMRPTPANHEQLEWVDCTSSRVAPVADGVGVVQGVGLALAIQVIDAYGVLGEGDGEVGAEGRVMQVASLGAAAVYLASAIHGFGSAEECQRAKELSNLRQLEQAKAEEREPVVPDLATPGCRSALECKGGRRCVAGSCSWPEPSAPTMPMTTTAPPTPAPIPAASPSQPAP